MAKMIYGIRRDTLEDFIAFYDAQEDFASARALRRLARHIGMDLDPEVLMEKTEKKRYYLLGGDKG